MSTAVINLSTTCHYIVNNLSLYCHYIVNNCTVYILYRQTVTSVSSKLLSKTAHSCHSCCPYLSVTALIGSFCHSFCQQLVVTFLSLFVRDKKSSSFCQFLTICCQVVVTNLLLFRNYSKIS